MLACRCSPERPARCDLASPNIQGTVIAQQTKEIAELRTVKIDKSVATEDALPVGGVEDDAAHATTTNKAASDDK